MPRHRKECIPQHRAQPPGGSSGWRGAAVNAAPAGSEAVYLAAPTSSGPGGDEAEDAFRGLTPDDLTLPLSSLPGHEWSDPAPSGPATFSAAPSGADPARPTHPGAAGSGAAGADSATPTQSDLANSGGAASDPTGSGAAEPRQGGQEPVRTSHRRARPAGPRGSRGMRGVLVTPWFAAGAGFVIAAALALNSPNTVLTYRPNTAKCSTCLPSQSLATARPGVTLKTAKPAPAVRSDRRARPATRVPQAAAGPVVGYRVVWQRNGAFGAIITVPSAEAGRAWSLRFRIPGHRILGVWGAQWAPGPSGYGGRVSSFVNPPPPGPSGSPSWPGTGQPGAGDPGVGDPGVGEPGTGQPGVGEPGTGQPGAGDPGAGDPGTGQPGVGEPGTGQPATGQPGGLGQPDRWTSEQLRFLISAQGTPRRPVGCVLNGIRCHFG
jgi:hypothetical protein